MEYWSSGRGYRPLLPFLSITTLGSSVAIIKWCTQVDMILYNAIS